MAVAAPHHSAAVMLPERADARNVESGQRSGLPITPGKGKIVEIRLFGSSPVFSVGHKPACDIAYSFRHAKAVYYTTANK